MGKELLFDIREWDNMYKVRLPKKDLVTLEEILNDYEDALFEINELEEQIKMLEKDIEDNYKPISPYEMYGISERDFH